MTRAEVERFAGAVADLLADPAAELTPSARLRWEGALTALEAVLGHPPTLLGAELAGQVRAIL